MIAFAGPPLIGTVLMLDSQAYELSDVVPHTRQDGTATSLLAWETSCAACGSSFRALTPAASISGLSRRCQSCKKPGKPVKGRRGRKLRVEVILP